MTPATKGLEGCWVMESTPGGESWVEQAYSREITRREARELFPCQQAMIESIQRDVPVMIGCDFGTGDMTMVTLARGAYIVDAVGIGDRFWFHGGDNLPNCVPSYRRMLAEKAEKHVAELVAANVAGDIEGATSAKSLRDSVSTLVPLPAPKRDWIDRWHDSIIGQFPDYEAPQMTGETIIARGREYSRRQPLMVEAIEG